MELNLQFLFCVGISPWGYTIGDIIGLFPVAYADRIKYAKTAGRLATYGIFFKTKFT
jgi:hypothetical protein